MKLIIPTTILALVFSSNPVTGEPTQKPSPQKPVPISFDGVIDNIEKAEKSGAWKKPDWDKSFFVDYIERTVNRTRMQTQIRSLRVPTSISEVEVSAVKPNLLQRMRVRGALIVTKSQDFLHISDSIVLSTGVVRAVSIENSIVISKGAIQASFCKSSLLFAGHYTEVGHDQEELFERLDEDDDAKIGGRSFLMSGSLIKLASAAGTVCYAPRFIKISHAKKVVILNSPHVKFSFDSGTTRTEVNNVGLISKRTELQLPKKLRSVEIVDKPKRPFFVLSHSGKEYVMRPGYSFPDEIVDKFQSTKKWKVLSIHTDYVLFENDKGDFAGCSF